MNTKDEFEEWLVEQIEDAHKRVCEYNAQIETLVECLEEYRAQKRGRGTTAEQNAKILKKEEESK